VTALKRLLPTGHRLVDETFLREGRRIGEDELAPHVEDTGLDIDLNPVDRVVQEVLSSRARFDDGIDMYVAPVLHRHMRLTRRQASDMGMWQYLAIARYADFVRHRWKYTTEKAMREKFLGEGPSNIYSHALHRLWWIAELTYAEDWDYSLTTQVLGFQQLANKIFDRSFARFKPASVACARVLLDKDATAPVVDAVTLRFRQLLTTLQLEALTEEEIRRRVESLVAEVAPTRRDGQ